jgi:calnexin
MQNDILFNNIYIGHSVEDAEALRKETFDVKIPIERAEEEAQKPKPAEGAPSTVSFREDPITYVREKAELFIGLARENPIEAVKAVPEIAVALGVLLVTMILVIVGAILVSTPATPSAAKGTAQKGKEAAGTAKEKTAEAVSSAADTAKGGATKRTTRGSAE